jgi:hypothetical protein
MSTKLGQRPQLYEVLNSRSIFLKNNYEIGYPSLNFITLEYSNQLIEDLKSLFCNDFSLNNLYNFLNLNLVNDLTFATVL